MLTWPCCCLLWRLPEFPIFLDYINSTPCIVMRYQCNVRKIIGFLKPKVTWFWLALNWKIMATRKSSRIAAKAKPLVKRTCRTPESAGKRIQCCICLGDISIRGRLSVCKHKFCYTCILEWSKVQQLRAKRIVMVFICRTSTRAQSARKDSGASRE